MLPCQFLPIKTKNKTERHLRNLFKIAFSTIFILLLVQCTSKPEKFALKEQLWYNQPAKEWLEALPLGNGKLGAMVFGSVMEEHLQLNEETLWAGMPEDPYPENVQQHYLKFQQLNLAGKFKEAESYGMEHLVVSPTSIRPYEPLGDLFISFDHSKQNITNYKRKLDLETGITTVEYSINGKQYQRESFISAKYNALFYYYSSVDGQPVNSQLRYARHKDIKQSVTDNIINIDGHIFDDPNGYDDNSGGSGQGGLHMKFASRIAVKSKSGQISAIDNQLIVERAKDFLVILTADTDYNPELMNFDRKINAGKNADDLLQVALQSSYETIKAEHIKSHQSLFNRVHLDIADIKIDSIPTNKRLEGVRAGNQDKYLSQVFFQYGRYLLMASSAFNAELPANLQGIWNKETWAAWDSDFHLNINLQMNYWPAEIGNLSETVRPLSNYMTRLSEKGTVTAQKYINSEGWVAHHATNAFGRTVPNGSSKESQLVNGYCFPIAGAWMSLTMWRHYEFTQDKAYLKEVAYPILKGAAQFFLDFTKENEKGELVTAPSYSPENRYLEPKSGAVLKNTIAATIDIQILRDLFNAVISSEQILGQNDLTKQLKIALAKLPPTKIGKDGTIMEWYEDYKELDPNHRHISHLFGLYPSSQITNQEAALYEAAKKTVEKRLASGGGQTGWSRAWIINFYARLMDGDACQKHIQSQLANQVTPNLFDLHPPRIFQIDGNLGTTAGIAEMLLQSNVKNTIRLLPALPSTWQTGSVKGLKARGNFEVAITWENGLLTEATVKAISGGTTTLVYQEKEIKIDLAPNEIYKYRPE
jgi:alpha-L-fucosidase 2